MFDPSVSSHWISSVASSSSHLHQNNGGNNVGRYFSLHQNATTGLHTDNSTSNRHTTRRLFKDNSNSGSQEAPHPRQQEQPQDLPITITQQQFHNLLSQLRAVQQHKMEQQQTQWQMRRELAVLVERANSVANILLRKQEGKPLSVCDANEGQEQILTKANQTVGQSAMLYHDDHHSETLLTDGSTPPLCHLLCKFCKTQRYPHRYQVIPREQLSVLRATGEMSQFTDVMLVSEVNRMASLVGVAVGNAVALAAAPSTELCCSVSSSSFMALKEMLSTAIVDSQDERQATTAEKSKANNNEMTPLCLFAALLPFVTRRLEGLLASHSSSSSASPPGGARSSPQQQREQPDGIPSLLMLGLFLTIHHGFLLLDALHPAQTTTHKQEIVTSRLQDLLPRGYCKSLAAVVLRRHQQLLLSILGAHSVPVTEYGDLCYHLEHGVTEA